MNNKSKLLFTIILVLALLMLGAVSYLIIESTRKEGDVAVVSVDGEREAEYPLSEDGEFIINGGSNILVIENGEAYIKSADCPDGLCIHQGKISRTGERIVCLPNKVMVEIFGDDEEIIIN